MCGLQQAVPAGGLCCLLVVCWNMSDVRLSSSLAQLLRLSCPALPSSADLLCCTGEHTCVMLQALVHPDVPNTAWLQPFVSDFKSRYIALLAGAFKVCVSVCVWFSPSSAACSFPAHGLKPTMF